MLLEWFYSPRAVGTPSSEVHALYRVHFYSSCSSCLLLTTDFVVIIIHYAMVKRQKNAQIRNIKSVSNLRLADEERQLICTIPIAFAQNYRGGGETSVHRLMGTASLKANQNFCSAMLCKRGLSRDAVSVCLCVSLSVTFVYSVEMNKHIFKIFSPSGSHAILVFPYTERYGNTPTERP